MEKKNYPIGSQFYKLYEELGQGVSATVRRALCIPFNEIVAIKILDFERNNSDLVTSNYQLRFWFIHFRFDKFVLFNLFYIVSFCCSASAQ